MANRYSWFVFAVTLICSAYFFPRWADWNENSRMDQILAIVDQHSLAIDQYYANTGDYAFYNGHYYSDKAPGTAFLGVPVYWFFKTVLSRPLGENLLSRLATNPALSQTLNQGGSGLLVDKINFFVALTFVTFIVSAIPSAFFGLQFYRLLGFLSTNEAAKVLLALAIGLATPAFAYANNLYGHQLAAVLLFAGFYFLFRAAHDPTQSEQNTRTRAFVASGFFISLAVITEYPSALIAAGICLYALYEFRHWGTVIWLGIGGIGPALLAGAYNLAAFGSPLSLGYAYSALWQSTHRVGFFSLSLPTAEALWGITLSPYRGLFFLSPFLLLAFPGMYNWARSGKFRAELWLVLWSFVSFLLFNAASAMWEGGFAVGPRYLVPMLPFLGLPIIFFLDWKHGLQVKGIAALTISWSAIAVWAETIGGQMFPQFQTAPLWEYSFPRLAAGDIARNVGMALGLTHWASLAPLFVLCALAALWTARARWGMALSNLRMRGSNEVE